MDNEINHMKELIRSLRLSRLLDIPLIEELKKLDDAILFIQNILNKMVLKTDKDIYPFTDFYFLDSKSYFMYNLKTTDLWCRYDSFWEVLESKYQYNNQEIKELVKDVVEEYFNNMEVTPKHQKTVDKAEVEEHFNPI